MHCSSSTCAGGAWSVQWPAWACVSIHTVHIIFRAKEQFPMNKNKGVFQEAGNNGVTKTGCYSGPSRRPLLLLLLLLSVDALQYNLGQ